MKFNTKLQKFMYGRYGIDELTNFLTYIYFILLIISLFSKNIIFLIIELILLIIIIFRTISKKIYKRSNENVKFKKIKKSIIKPFNNIKRNIKDKDHIYRKCPKCKTILKLKVPDTNGIKHIKCTNCNHRIKTFVIKKKKIEIIK